MDDDTPHKPRSRSLGTRTQVRAIDDWIAQERKLISTRKKMKRRFMLEIIGATGMRAPDAENLFERLVQNRRAQAVCKKGVRSTGETFHPEFYRLRSWYARWVIDTSRIASCVSDAPDVPEANADRECQSCRFDVDVSPGPSSRPEPEDGD